MKTKSLSYLCSICCVFLLFSTLSCTSVDRKRVVSFLNVFDTETEEAEQLKDLESLENAKGTITSYDTATTAASDDVVVGVDVSDTSMASTGTTKKFPLSTFPISTVTQAALDLKLSESQIDTEAELEDVANVPLASESELTTGLALKENVQTAASQAEAEAGTQVSIRSFSPLRIFQAIAAWITANTSAWDKDSSDDVVTSATSAWDKNASDDMTTSHAANSITSAGSGVVISSVERTKLNGIATGAEVNVNADWNSSSGDSQISNKPTIPTVSDTAYDATSWDTNTDAASKNAVRDKIEAMPNVSIGTANGLSLSTQALSLAAATNSTAGAATAAQITSLEAVAAKLPAGTDGTYGLDSTPNTTISGAPTLGAGLRPLTATGVWYYYNVVDETWDELGSGGIEDIVEDLTPQLGGDLDLNGKNLDFPTTVNISDVLDDDTFATASATTLATSESTKAYLDAQIAEEMAPVLTALENALLNIFYFSFTTPAATPYYADASPVDLSVDVTDLNSSYSIASVQYQVDGAGYTDNDLTNTSGDTWDVSLEFASDDSYVIQLLATDDKATTPNTGESVERTIILDTIDPVVDLTAVHDQANPTTHDGSGTATYIIDKDETVVEDNLASLQWRWVDGVTAGEWQTWSSPWADVSATLLESTNDLTMELEATDLAGNTGSDTVVVGYSVPVVATLCDTNGDGVNDYLFCCGWEEGSDLLNTGATIESVFDYQSAGTALSKTTSTMEPSSGIQKANLDESSKFLSINTANLPYVEARFLFKLTNNKNNDGNVTIVRLRNNQAYNEWDFQLKRISGVHYLEGAAIVLNTSYEVVLRWGRAGSLYPYRSYSVYDSTGNEVFASTPVSVTSAYLIALVAVGEMIGTQVGYEIDGFTVNTTEIDRWY